jgi:hypothetical protein
MAPDRWRSTGIVQLGPLSRVKPPQPPRRAKQLRSSIRGIWPRRHYGEPYRLGTTARLVSGTSDARKRARRAIA